MGRRGYPTDLVGALIFLAPASDYLTGQTIVVVGGYLIG
jgi:NAD(P)-dependent dehydrogenase (short-subunit alcohol dehydrogenase family)